MYEKIYASLPGLPSKYHSTREQYRTNSNVKQKGLRKDIRKFARIVLRVPTDARVSSYALELCTRGYLVELKDGWPID
jgi:hypothetical protein